MLSFFFVLINSSAMDTFFTILLSNGRNKTTINSYSDAVNHGRAGSGKSIEAGPELLQDILKNEAFINFYNEKNGTILSKLESRLYGVTKSNKEGNFYIETADDVIECEHEIMHHFNISYGYNMTYKCVDISFSDLQCTIFANVSYFGSHFWNFDRVDDNSMAENNVELALPYFLVKWRGNFKPFNITYSYNKTYEHTFDLAVFE